MFGDDPNPTVTTTRVGFGYVSDAHARGLCTMQRDKANKEEGNENPVGLETVNESKGGRGNYEQLQF